MRLDIIPATETHAWMRILGDCEKFDCYHLPGYHLLSEAQENGTGMLFVYHEDTAIGAWPFLLREISTIEGLEVSGAGYRDMTSVYGYPGPIWNAEAKRHEGFFTRFQEALEKAAREMRVVSMFSRMSPLLRNADRIGTIGVLERIGQTVSIDLTEPEDAQLRAYRKDHRDGIRRSARRGCQAFHDVSMDHFCTFISLYNQTMTRVTAEVGYFFDQEYFTGLRATMGEHLHLFVATLDSTPCSAGLFIHTGTIVQFHLSGSTDVGLKHGGSKLVVEEARKWGTSVGARYLHLGGGVGSREDSLFYFKSGFSRGRHDFLIWKNILQPDLYHELVRTHKEHLSGQGYDLPDDHFFPAYRANPVRRVI